ncbi:hypothetical protein EhV352 [Emiliania huxleyi virus 86]|uniref:Uncharacterized protein n=1 Tax=Emiliania huxleyi virus 86 (isolate United Kingdom/English Channel/1999) TaxID=654925 RepID=Q4A2C7_EHV8U|nr:hypothetical protein EhV352 [Emiliania huxleyi virus 86]AEO97800.1 hypothetical protein ENVG_00267 [Emiliania huxleyi virus 84]AEP15278.1 hypothetical protein EOVG_00341 [Emiliania huxleyi virus 88]UKZ11375.1 hypothetical protein EhVM1_000360 [Emiliania huxleyi virus M1]CAI65779.1 hypothetical protein EhV352 [Emiliania huxleyi virus 86]
MTLNTDEVECNNAGGNCPKYDAVKADGIKDSNDSKKVVQSKKVKADHKAAKMVKADKKNMTRTTRLVSSVKFWKWLSKQTPEVQAEVMAKAPPSRSAGMAAPVAGSSGAAAKGANVAK